MKPRAHLLLALLLGILLQSGLVTVAGTAVDGRAAACGAADPGPPAGPLEPFSRDVGAGAQPYIAGAAPEPVTAANARPHEHSIARVREKHLFGAEPPRSSRPVYLTTQRLRL